MWQEIRPILSEKYAQRFGYIGAFIYAPLLLFLFKGNSYNFCAGIVGGCYGLLASFIICWGISYLGIEGLNNDTEIPKKTITLIIFLVTTVIMLILSTLFFIILPIVVNGPEKGLDAIRSTFDTSKFF